MAEEKKTTKTVAKKPATAKAVAKKPATKKPATTKAVAKKPATSTKTTVKSTSVEKVAPVSQKETKPVTKKVKVTLVKSPFGYNKNQIVIVRTLGLNKMNSSNVLPDNASTRGMVRKVRHLVKLEELD